MTAEKAQVPDTAALVLKFVAAYLLAGEDERAFFAHWAEREHADDWQSIKQAYPQDTALACLRETAFLVVAGADTWAGHVQAEDGTETATEIDRWLRGGPEDNL
jgi:hypothetical protein